MSARFNDNEFKLLKELLLSYEWVHRTMLTKLNIIHEAHKYYQNTNPIGYITGRIKSAESIASKLHKQGVELTAKNAKNHLNDIAGIRIICPYAKDIYFLAELIRSMPDGNIISEKDYVTNPKHSGYRSYHIIMEIEIYHSGKTETLPIEIQIRTEAMNFWATLEHQAKYKYKEQIPKHLSDELIICADKIAELDDRMFLIHEIISLINNDSG
ncbi:MAG: GTP pyrophosphokinase family protein [Defluviitaleaceae bacterium]|nr:GTP pyrophosphokinase family protein [Defluviitaleaceae bacterium]